MSQASVLDALKVYQHTWASGQLEYLDFDAGEEMSITLRLRDFVARQSRCFERDCHEGHVTASALVCSPALDQVLLTLHRKLGKWLQLGGHTDGSADVAAAALREAQEESGVGDIYLLPSLELFPDLPSDFAILPFDADIHEIPARGPEPAHLHYDLRYLAILDPAQPLQISSESKDLRWFTWEDAWHLCNERSMRRQFAKVQAVRCLLQGR